MDFFSAAAQILPVLYLAIILEVFGNPKLADLSEEEKKRRRRTPLGLGLRWRSDRSDAYKRWMNAQPVFGLVALGVLGEAFALAGSCPPIIAAALAYFGVLLFERPLVWGFQMVGSRWIEAQQDLAVHSIFLAPPTGAIVAGLLVAA